MGFGPNEPRPRDLARLRDIDEPWCPEMVVIPAGEFLMGSPDKTSEQDEALFLRHKGSEVEWENLHLGLADERPCHAVRIARRFAVGRFPVTFEEYDAYCDATGQPDPGDDGWGRGRRPVIHVSWEDAWAYADWLSAQTEKVVDDRYRLLAEAEWEYACRAGTRTSHSWGIRGPTKHDANFGLIFGKTTEVGSFPANGWGLYDMHGNVWEWTQDAWSESYEGAPADGSAWEKGPEKRARVFRGGSWSSKPGDLRSAIRSGYDSDLRHHFIGFRLARTLV